MGANDWRMWAGVIVLTVACADPYDQACEEAAQLEDQQTCVSEVGDQARLDVDDRLAEELNRVPTERTRDRLEGKADSCREAIDSLLDRVRSALADADREEERRIIIQSAVDDLRHLVARCSDD